MPTVTLPGGSGNTYKLAVGTDAQTALTAAIKAGFKAAGSNTTLNEVKSGDKGKAGFFNAIVNSTGKGTFKAGDGVQAIFDNSKGGHNTLIGGSKTTLIYANESASKGDSISATGKVTIFGTKGSDSITLTNGNATVFGDGGKNVVKLVGNDSITAAGGKISVVGGTGTISFTHGVGSKDTVKVTKNTGTDTFVGAGTDKKGSDVFAIGKTAGGSFVITAFGKTDKIKILGASKADITKALGHITVKGGVQILKIGNDKFSVTGVALGTKNFTK